MTWSVYQHWDPLRVCIVGRSYPPEFYSWIKISHVRELFERIAIETEEDYQGIIKKLQEFGVEVMRPDLPNLEDALVNGQYLPPPMNPRDHTVMIGDRFYNGQEFSFQQFFENVKDVSWPDCKSYEDFLQLPQHIQNECNQVHGLQALRSKAPQIIGYDQIFEKIKQQGNQIFDQHKLLPNGAMVSRIGRDLYFGTNSYSQDQVEYQRQLNKEFPHTRNHIVNTGGHSDATYCPVAPGLIFSLYDVPTYKDTYPGWEVIYLVGPDWSSVKPFLHLKESNRGAWWIPGFEYNQDVTNIVETWMNHWVGYVEETVFDVNMLIVDPKNVLVFSYNKQVFDALERYGITPHIVPFRHRFFWDGGIHCVTSDLHREGVMQNYFLERD